MTWLRESDGTYSCTEHATSFSAIAECPSCTPEDSPLAADQTDSTNRPGQSEGGESVLSIVEVRERVGRAANRQRRIARDARRIGIESDGMDEETRACRQLRLSSLNLETLATDRELKALTAAGKLALEAAEIEQNDRLIAEAKAGREAGAVR